MQYRNKTAKPSKVDAEIGKASLGGWYVKSVVCRKPIGLTVYYLASDSGFAGYCAAYYRVHWMGRTVPGEHWNTTMMTTAPATTATR